MTRGYVSRWLLLGLALSAGLPLVAHWARRDRPAGCALDGVPIEALYRVRVLDRDGHAHDFCGPRCARLWLKRHARPVRAVRVTDETTGAEVDAGAAWYVRSAVATARAVGARVHVFARRADAERHAATFAGTVLEGDERPLPVERNAESPVQEGSR